MSKFKITGPSRLSGEIEVYGAKNAAMKLLAACVLIPGRVTLNNVPDILDIENIIKILTQNGAKITRSGHTLEIDTSNLTDADPNPELVTKLRGSIVLIGPYLARFGRIRLPQPGGDAIGTRPINDHLDGFRQMGAAVARHGNLYEISGSNLKAAAILIRPSVTATENLMMAQVLTPGKSIIKNVAREPQIKDLANFLNQAGAKITGAGSDTITIEGVEKLQSVTYSVMPDPFETATFVCLGLVTKSPLKITRCRPNQMSPFPEKLAEMGVNLIKAEDSITVPVVENLKATDIVAEVFPGFSTDMLPQIALVLTQANGESYINETLYENRLGYLKELQNMGAKVKIINAHEAQIWGPTKLYGAKIESLDIRAGATLILAGLAAEGETIIDDAEIIDRGYEKIEERLQKVGARIERIQ